MRQWMFLAGVAIAMTGCITTGPTDETGARLPTGVTLLESEESRCSGIVHIDNGVSRGRETVLRPGENASFRVDDERIQWTCIGENSSDDDGVDCPRDTSYVRVTRPAGGDQFLLECYG